MGNKALSSPIPSFAVAVRSLADAEVEHLGGVFKSMSRGRDIVTLQSFVEVRVTLFCGGHLFHSLGFDQIYLTSYYFVFH